MPVPKVTPATRLADAILDALRPLIAEATEARLWHTKRDRRKYFEGYGDCSQAVRDAVIRAAETTLFEDAIERGDIEPFRTKIKTDRRRNR